MRKAGRKPYVQEVKPGFVYFYRGGKCLHRFTAPEGTAEFDRQYWEVMTGKTQEAKRSWAAAIRILRDSDRWAAKSVRYRQDLDPILVYLDEKIDKRDVARLTQADIYDAMDKNKHRVRFANYIPVAISMIAKELVRRRWLSITPPRGSNAFQCRRIDNSHMCHGPMPQLPSSGTKLARWNA